MTKINDRSSLFQKAYSDREDLRYIRKGTKAMKAAGTKYLPQHPGESNEEYKIRLNASVLHNVTARIIDVLTSRPFKKQCFIQTKNEKIDKLNKNFDGTGETLTDFARALFQEGLWDSQAHIFIDFTRANSDISGNPIYTPNQKHRVRILDNDYMKFARYDNETGELTYLRFGDFATVEGEYDDEEVEIVWEFKKENGVVYSRKSTDVSLPDDAEKYFMKDEWTVFGLPFIPLVSFYPKPTKTKFRPKIIFQDMAELNITHWQSYSEQRNVLKFARIPILFFKGVNIDDIKLGSQFAISSTNENADGKYIETTSSAIKQGREDVIDLEQKMQALGFELLAKRQGVQTATGASLDMESTNSMLGCFAVSLKETLEQVIKVIAAWYDLEDEFELVLETKFHVEYNDEKIRTLLAIWQAGGIKTEAFLSEMKKHGVIHDDADLDLIMGLAGVNEEF